MPLKVVSDNPAEQHRAIGGALPYAVRLGHADNFVSDGHIELPRFEEGEPRTCFPGFPPPSPPPEM